MYCEKCKKEVEGVYEYCPQCGQKLVSHIPSALEEFENINQQTGGAEPAHEKHDNLMMVAGYIFPILLLIPFLIGRYKKSDYIHFHTWQIIRLTILSVVGSLVLQIMTALIPVMMVVIVFSLFSIVFSVFCTVLSVIGIINAWRYETTPLPLIGNLFEKIGV